MLLTCATMLAVAGCASSSQQKTESSAEPAATETPAEADTPADAPASQPADAPASQPMEAASSFDAVPAVGTFAACAVTGEKFHTTADTEHSTHEGRVYVFCCDGCKGKFDKDPASYLSKS